MIRRYGIDTSVLVRLLTGVPEADFAKSVQGLSVLVRDEGAGHPSHRPALHGHHGRDATRQR